jgi:ATP-binding cassette, subfamily C (CFTR/MRP), member 1
MVLDKGKIIEYNSPKNLLSRKDSVFYSMAAAAGIV